MCFTPEIKSNRNGFCLSNERKGVTMLRTVTIVFLLGIGASSTLAEILHVPDNYSTIQGAMNAAVEGDTVLVAAGTYVENINFRGKNITVTSNFMFDQDP